MMAPNELIHDLFELKKTARIQETIHGPVGITQTSTYKTNSLEKALEDLMQANLPTLVVTDNVSPPVTQPNSILRALNRFGLYRPKGDPHEHSLSHEKKSDSNIKP